MAEELTIIQNDYTRFGLRRVHVMRSGEKVNAEKALFGMVPHEGTGSLDLTEWHEKDLNMWHLWAFWRAHDPVMNERGVKGILWYLEPGTRLTEELEKAAYRYIAYWGEFPDTAWVDKIRPGWKDHAEFQGDEKTGEVAIKILEERVPENCVFLWRDGAPTKSPPPNKNDLGEEKTAEVKHG